MKGIMSLLAAYAILVAGSAMAAIAKREEEKGSGVLPAGAVPFGVPTGRTMVFLPDNTAMMIEDDGSTTLILGMDVQSAGGGVRLQSHAAIGVRQVNRAFHTASRDTLPERVVKIDGQARTEKVVRGQDPVVGDKPTKRD